MQERLTELQIRLESEETERRSLEERRRQAEDGAAELVRRLTQVEEKLHQCESVTQGAVEAEALKMELANERQSHRELMDQVEEKNTLVRSLQDALVAEQVQNKSLQAKLEAVSTTQVRTWSNLAVVTFSEFVRGCSNRQVPSGNAQLLRFLYFRF